MNINNSATKFVICIQNENYSASLEVRKIYRVLPDDRAMQHHLIRVIDESGEDYLYPEDYFIAIELPEAAEKIFAIA